MNATASDHRPALYCDLAVPQLQFVAQEARPDFLVFPLDQWKALRQSFTTQAPRVVVRIKRSVAPEQSYVLTRKGRTFSIAAPDANGAMYGALDLLEAYRTRTLDALKPGERRAYIEKRGIKINIPLDARTPSYSDTADAAQANIGEMWSLDFWHSLLDEMARFRYNVLTLWNLHPFPSMVKVPEYPDVALADVMRTTHPFHDRHTFTGVGFFNEDMAAHLETVKHMTVDEKIRFWQNVMQYAKDRGIETYLVVWNIFTFGATGKYGITDAQDNPVTIAYTRASVRELVLTYPHLAGIGITAAENMDPRLQGEYARERWLWQTFGQGVFDALEIQPYRKVKLIHRYHQAGAAEIFEEWKDYPGEFELSFKYAMGHVYSAPKPPFVRPILDDLPPGRRTWLTIRDDDVYSFRWGNAAYVRDYIKAIPRTDKIAGIYIGPDGDTWGREFIAKTPKAPRELVVSKRWYSFLLWGRLAYEPELSSELLTQVLAVRFPGVDAQVLQDAWANASMVFPLITRFFWDDTDHGWYPEANWSHPRRDKGFYSVRHYIEGRAMPGAGVMTIREWLRCKVTGEACTGVTPLEIAEALETSAAAALHELQRLQRSDGSAELLATLCDIEAMSHLGNYYASKIRGSAALALFDAANDPADRETAVAELEHAHAHWRSYAAAFSSQYTSPHLYCRVGFVDIPGLIAKAEEDVLIARGWQPGTI